MGLVTLIFDLLTLKLVCESHLRRGTFLPKAFGFSNYSLCTRWTDRRMDARLIAVVPTVGGDNNTTQA